MLLLPIVAAFGGVVLGAPFDVTSSPKPVLEDGDPPPGVGVATSTPGPQRSHSFGEPLALRLVDAGAVGIPADTASWGTTYSHATHAFDELLLPSGPWVDAEEFERVRRDWIAYVDRMAAYGNNGVIVDAFLEFINFDRVDDGRAVYEADSPLRARHRAIQHAFRGLFEHAEAAGMGIFLKTDMLALTGDLERHLLDTTGGLDPADPRLWAVYAAGLDELFTNFPEVRGVVVRVGEAGALYNIDGLDYRSEMALRTPRHVDTMLKSLLPVFERHERTLVFRSWSVGLGELGDLHNEPTVYASALADIDSPALVVSTKYTRGDYFGFLPLNPTLLAGSQKRIVEFQARREFEGFGAFPNELGGLHQRALRQILTRNPNVVGVSLWTQEGGPLKAGPISLYPLSGFWRWIDASVFTTSRLAQDPEADVEALRAEWVRQTISTDPAVVAAYSEVLNLSRDAVEKAWYLRPFAERQVVVGDFDLPPLMWIQEWDHIGGWSAVSSAVYEVVGDDRERAIADGFEAVELTRRMRARLEAVTPNLPDDPTHLDALRSLAYQESLFETLAWWRATMLNHQHWLRSGDPGTWRADGARFGAAAEQHRRAWSDDLDFPAFEFQPAVASLGRSQLALASIPGARWTLLALVVLAALTLRVEPPSRPLAQRVVSGCAGVGLWVLIAAFFVPEGRWLPVGAFSGVFAAAVLTLKVTRGGIGWSRADLDALAALWPLAVPAVVVLGAVAVRGPQFFWQAFWTSPLARSAFLASIVWALLHVAWRLVHRGDGAALAATLGAVGLYLAAVLPGLEDSLRSVDSLLGVMPMTRGILNGILVYGGLPRSLALAPLLVGGLLLLVGVTGLRRRGPLRSSAGLVTEGLESLPKLHRERLEP